MTMTVLEELLNKIGNARPNQRTISIPMEMAVKIAFMISRLEQIVAITDEVKERKYTELNKTNAVSDGEQE